MFKKVSSLILLFVLTLSAQTFAGQSAAQNPPKTWDVEAEHGPTSLVEFDTDEGTWMSCDVSPDGQIIVFDLLGDIYKIPISGGPVELLSGGVSWDGQPRFSPDGKSIAFTSDRDGGDNIWVMDADGKNRRQLTKETYRLTNSPVWTPDGQYIICRKHFVDTRSLGAGEKLAVPGLERPGRKITARVLSPHKRRDQFPMFLSLKVFPECLLHYNRNMARGWESKAIEDQLAANEAEKEAKAKPFLTASEIERQTRKNSLQLSRLRTLKDLEATGNEGYRALLERTLAHLDAELARIESSDDSYS